MVNIVFAAFSGYFLLSQLSIISQCSPLQVVSYSPIKILTPLTKNDISAKLQKCPPCPLVNEKSLIANNKPFISSKSICPPQTGKCLAVIVNSTSGAVNYRDERCCCCDCCCCRPCCCCCKPCCCCCCKPCCCCCCRPCCCCCRPCCCCCCKPCCCCNCCGCKRHRMRRHPCNDTTMKMVDVLPTPPILMKIKSE